MSLNVVFRRASIEAAMEFGSLRELAGYVGEECVLLTKIFGDDMEIVVKGLSDGTALSTGTVEAGGEQSSEAAAGEAPKGRGRPKKTQPDPSTAQAPPPAAIPGAPVDTTPNANGMPAFLDRAATPVPAVVPPSGILAGKVIADLDRRGTDDTTKAALVNWLASPGLALVMPAASYDEAISAIRLMPDDKLAAVATQLAVS